MNYYMLAIVLIALIFGIVIARLIHEIHKLCEKIKALNEYNYESMDIIREHIIKTKDKIEVIATFMDYKFEQLNVIEQYIRTDLIGELNAIGRTTTEQADIMLKIEEKINSIELERPDEKEGNEIESE